ncbi:MAG TPA: helix-turn-helix transcriptional regulator [Saprospiraceae bacterium]|nr:helix-turn-helix transcriptional regulator [Saprospiraceae bacterium]HNE63572.1 helix-turn-helix transcriptional regulator [Saprospiraceae bacterium]HNG69570.1 helix-turn-helix transcriptional regulator [Saprospiraceae bacterium]HNO71966.1 helix-turn-helix transcriptional regulator [Bacteroidia bacterium]
MIRVSDLKDKTLGKIGTPKRDKYERELKLEIIAEQIKQLREEKNLTQDQLGELIGVQRAQVSKLENSTTNITLGTIIKVFDALDAQLSFQIHKKKITKPKSKKRLQVT